MTTVQLVTDFASRGVRLWADGDRVRYAAREGVLTPAMLTELRERKAEILEFLREQDTPRPPLRRSARENPPLSFAQQRLWFLDQLVPNSAFYNVPAAIPLGFAVSVPVLERAVNEIVRRHESLRTSFKTEDGQPVQVIAPSLTIPLPVIDISDLPPADREAEVRRLADAEAQRPFDLTTGPLIRTALLRLTPADHVFLLTLHHVVADGWSMGVLYRELAALYLAFASGQPSPLPELAIQYADYAAWQREWLHGDVLDRQLAYWRRQLADLPVLQLPTDRPRPAVQSYRGAYKSLVLPAAFITPLREVGRQNGATLFMTMLAAFTVLLHRYTGQTDLVVGCPIAGRTRGELEPLIGFFVNTLVLRTDASSNPTFRQLLRRVRQTALDAYAHQDVPFESLVEALHPARDLGRNPLFQVAFQLLSQPDVREAKSADATIQPLSVKPGTAKFDLEFDLSETADGVYGHLEYSTDLFDAASMDRLLGHFEQLLRGIADDPDTPIARLPLLTPAEHELVVREWNRTASPFPDTCLAALFEEVATRTPEALAVVWGDTTLTYTELQTRANRLANALQQQGVGPSVLVAVCIERSPALIIALVAVAKAGGAYVPLDPAYPEARLQFMLDDSQAAVLLTEERWLPRCAAYGGITVCVDRDAPQIDAEGDDTPPCLAAADDLAYVMYTSGSTGLPKGVCVPQRAVIRLVRETDYVQLGPDDRVAQASNASFDAATFEIWGALLNGARLVGVTKDVALAGREFAEQIRRQGITTLFLTTALFNQIAAEVPRAFAGLRHLLFGGSAVDPGSVRQVLRQGPPANLLHVYGPTETTTFATWHRITHVPDTAVTLPIGRPIRNTETYVLDADRQPVPINVVGELYIGGPGVASGYLGRPELTASRFVHHPFSQQPDVSVYRTGDLVRYRSDGSIEFVGRSDHQVKIRGFRVELGEIEAVLTQHPLVERAAVTALCDQHGDRRLVAYLVPAPAATDDAGRSVTANLEAEQVAQWQSVFDRHIYERLDDVPDPTFNTRGWISMYNGEPLPPADMREWLDDTVGHLTAGSPKRVLEIGCGTGLLLFKVAPHVDEYVATDFSATALEYVRRTSERSTSALEHLRLMQRNAHEFDGFDPQHFDLVVLNSIVQYFPDVDYLVRVIERAVSVVRPGGRVFIGDVRSLPLLEALHATIGIERVQPATASRTLRDRVRTDVSEENELVIDPAFFERLRDRIRNIDRVDVALKRGRIHNELTRFRYQVTLHVGSPDQQPVERRRSTHTTALDWDKERWTLPALRRHLRSADAAGSVRIASVPNARVASAAHLVELLSADDAPARVEELTARSARLDHAPVDPQDLVELAFECGYSVQLDWSRHDSDGRFDAILSREGSAEQFAPKSQASGAEPRDLREFANNPLRGHIARVLVPQVRTWMQSALPDYMVPSQFVLLDALPLTPNGKVDTNALPAPGQQRPEMATAFVAPRTPVETALSRLWGEVMGVERIGVHDDFFAELGGHSLLATRVISRIRDAFDVDPPLRQLFEAPTIAGFAERLLEDPSTRLRLERAAELYLSLDAMPESELDAMLATGQARTAGQQ